MLEPVCTASALLAGEPTAGSAPFAAGWVCLEQNGPWGARAWTASYLDPVLGARIEGLAKAADVRPSLIRHPGRHPDLRDADPRTVLIAHSHPANPWLLTGKVGSPELLLRLDWAAVRRGDLAAVRSSLPQLAPSVDVQLLVCTNGARDTCCARLGRPVAAGAAAVYPNRVWEVTHTSGHRFAPTTVLLPSGQLHGRVLDAIALLEAADAETLLPTGQRGRSCWPPAGQVAEIKVRETESIAGIDDLAVSELSDPQGPVSTWLVRHTDGRSWRVTVSASQSGERAESCGKDLKPVIRYLAETARIYT